MYFEELFKNQENRIREMSDMAISIVREHFDPLIGTEQNDYIIKKFQTADSIRKQL